MSHEEEKQKYEEYNKRLMVLRQELAELDAKFDSLISGMSDEDRRDIALKFGELEAKQTAIYKRICDKLNGEQL